MVRPETSAAYVTTTVVLKLKIEFKNLKKKIFDRVRHRGFSVN